MLGLYIYKVLRIYDVEKRCAVLKNLAGFMRLPCIHSLIVKANLVFPQALYELKGHQC